MLDSSQIEEVLEDLGLELDQANKRVHGLISEDGRIRVYVKTTESGSPMTKNPLVIHPDYGGNRERLEGLGLGVGGAYRNSNMNEFPKTENGNGKWERTGLALSIPSEASLRQLIPYVKGGESSGDVISDLEQAKPELAELDATTKQQVVDARRGQGAFRIALEKAWGGGCAITRTANSSLLRASHIKPWRDADNRERLDPDNGLLLLATLDAAFDTGFISFDDAGRILISEELAAADATGAGIEPSLRLMRTPSSAQKGFLNYHREHVFRD